jgi:hypothetical protein
MRQLPDHVGPINNARWAIEGVQPADAGVPWRRVWELLARAVARFPGTERKWTSDGLLYEVMCGNAQLWIAWSYQRRRIDGAVISRLFDNPEHTPGKRIMECPLVAGEHMADWGAEMFALLTAWGRAQGCDYIVGYGRPGWKRLFGFAERGRTDDGLPILVRPIAAQVTAGGQMTRDSAQKDQPRVRAGRRKSASRRQKDHARSSSVSVPLSSGV